MRMTKTKTQQLQEIVQKYRDAGQEWPASARMIASWAIAKGLWGAQRKSLITQCAKEFAHALREEYVTDPQGRRVRKMHALRDIREMPSGKHVQTMLWVDIHDATPGTNAGSVSTPSSAGARRLSAVEDRCR